MLETIIKYYDGGPVGLETLAATIGEEAITLEDLVKAASLSRSSLTQLFKAELEMTPIEYLWHHRLVVAKDFLNFTNLPIKDIVSRCGFKTVQHFSRKFEEKYSCNPTTFRNTAVSNRIKTFEST